jgi:hypothetical protein
MDTKLGDLPAFSEGANVFSKISIQNGLSCQFRLVARFETKASQFQNDESPEKNWNQAWTLTCFQ